MRIAYITAGAAGMYCGSCLHDNTLASTLIAQGHDAILVPTYTPITTDEPDVSSKRVFFGGINVYLQERFRLFRYTPWFVDRLLDFRPLLRWVSRFAIKTDYADLGGLTVSMLEGENGHQRKEVAKLVHWLARDIRPEIVNLSNVLLSGAVHEIKRVLGVPVVASLQGDDIFLEALPEPFRTRSLELIRDHCKEIDGFLSTSNYYADFMSEYLSIPRERIQVVYPGLNLKGHGRTEPRVPGKPLTIGYFARICPEKGLHVLADALHRLRETAHVPEFRVRVSGWLGARDRVYFDDVARRLNKAGIQLKHVESPDHVSKVRFLQELDVLSVPTTYREPKGLFVLEALANGVPVVQPRHGSFPELVERTGGGLLHEPGDADDLARVLHLLLDDHEQRSQLGQRGQEAVLRDFNAAVMTEKTLEFYEQIVRQEQTATPLGQPSNAN